MKGSHHIVVESERLKYEFDIKRNITVIQGDSATGKTTLVELLNTYAVFGTESGISLQSDVKCSVYGGGTDDWKGILETYNDSIVFFDEDHSFIFEKEFAEAIKGTSNYYVFITRQPLYNIPYSIREIYGIRTSGKFHFPEQIYQEFYPIYSDIKMQVLQSPIILVEDSGSGYQFYCRAFDGIRCISAQGNAGIAREICDLPGNCSPVVIADGAAFGAYMANVYGIIKSRSDALLYLPESFEWIILKSGVISAENLDDILSHPERYIDSAEYFSWEQYFTDILSHATENDPVKSYSKRKLASFYLEGKNLRTIINEMPKEVVKLIQESTPLI